MPAPDELTLRRFLLGELSAGESATVEAFIDTDPDSGSILERLKVEDSFTAALRGRTQATGLDSEVESLASRIVSIPFAADRTRTLGASESESSVDPANARTSEDIRQLFAPPQAPDELGRLGDYRILRVLGEGGMGMVFEAEDQRLGRRVAVKVMRPSVALSPTAKARFIREAKAAAAVEHDHVVHIHLIAEERGVPFLVMPYLKGESLDDRLKREGTIPISEIVRIAREIAEGLAAAHDRGLIHRDIKPGNIWLEAPSGRVKILDFGLARGVNTEAPNSDITQNGAVVGTPAYMSPEQGRGQPVDVRSDLFSLGGVMYRMATGRTAFTGTDSMSVLMSLAADTPVDPRSLNPQVPASIASLIMRLLEKNPAKRPQSAREVAASLAPPPLVEMLPTGAADLREEFAFDEGPTETVPQALPVEETGRKRWRRHHWMIAVACVLAFGIAIYIAPTVIRIATNKGELVIEVDDPNIEVLVKPDAAHVVMDKGKTKERRIVLKAGDYDVEFFDPETGAHAFTKQFTIERGGKAVVTATRSEVVAARKPKTGPVAISPPDDKIPPKDLFPGELIAYETFDDPTKCPWPLLKTAVKQTRCEHGVYILDVPNAKPEETESYDIGGPAKDVAIATRVRATNGSINVSFRRRTTGERESFVNLQISPDGTWTLRRLTWDLVNDDWKLAAEKMLANDDAKDPELAAGKWVAIRVLSNGPITEVWAGPKMNVRVVETESADEQLPLHRSGVGIGATFAARGPARFEFDYVAVWKLAPANSAAPWTGDQPPPKDLFPGEVAEYETFEDPKKCKLVPDTDAKVTYGVKDGMYVVTSPADTGRVPTRIGEPLADNAFVLRYRHAENTIVDLRLRSSKSQESWLTLILYMDGTWRLKHARKRLVGKNWVGLDDILVAESADLRPELAANKWVTLVGRFTGDDYEFWANGQLLCRGTAKDVPPPGETYKPTLCAVSIESGRTPAKPLRFELKYAAVWKLAPANNAAPWTGDKPPPRDLFPGEVVEYETFDDPKTCKLFIGDAEKINFAVQGGRYVVSAPAEAGRAATRIGAPVGNYAFVMRFRNPDPTIVDMRLRASTTQESWLKFVLRSDGGWRLFHARKRLEGKKMLPLEDELLTQSLDGRADLAANQWVTLVGKIVGNEYELWANGRLLCRGTIVDNPPVGETSKPFLCGVSMESWPAPGKPFHYELGYAAVWKLPASSGAPLSASQRKALEWIVANGGWVDVKVNGQACQIVAPNSVPEGPLELQHLHLNDSKGQPDKLLESLRNLPPGVTTLSLQDTRLRDSDMAELVSIPALSRVNWLNLSTNAIRDSGVSQLEKMTSLAGLMLNTTLVTDAGIKHLVSLKLRSLELMDCPGVNDAAMNSIAKLSELTILKLRGTQVTTEGVKKLRTLAHLEDLILSGETVTDDTLKVAADLPAVTILTINSSRVTDSGIEALKGVDRLNRLNLNCKNLTDACLDHLLPLKKLKFLSVEETKVTEAGVKKLVAALPGCKIEWNGGTINPAK